MIAAAQPLTAAVLGWSVDDDHYVSHREAKQLAAWLEADLVANEQYQWVDRANLEAAREELSLAGLGGVIDPATWLRVGRWVQADLIVTGRAYPEGDGWALLGQVIDVERADVLTSWGISVAGENDKPLNLAGLDTTPWLAKAGEAVA